MYKVNIEKFEGPLDLLLEIIEAKKLSLIEISLAQVTDQFISYLEKLGKRDPEEIIQFLVIASRLALLKSRELIPSDETTAIEQEGNLKELERQLALYQPFRKAAEQLKRLEKERASLYHRQAFAGFKNIFYFPRGLNTNHLNRVLDELLKTITSPKRIPQARLKDIIPLQMCIKYLSKAIKQEKKLDFLKFIKEEKEERRLVYFLGVLELSRLGKINTDQKSNFGKIIIQQT